MEDLGIAGQWFESQAVQHLRIFVESLGGRVPHSRDKSGREADIVVELDDGRWAVFEIKFGQRQISTVQTSLVVFVDDVDTKRMPPAEFTAVITADGPMMTLPNGLVTFPLRALRP